MPSENLESQEVREALMQILLDNWIESDHEPTAEDCADAILVAFPILSAEPEWRFGIKRIIGDVGTVMPLHKHEAVSYHKRTGSPIMKRELRFGEWQEVVDLNQD